jgi:hypothetical protein
MWRTYLPTLYKIMRLLCMFIERHFERIIQTIGEENRVKLEALATACSIMEAVVYPFIQPTDG